MPSTALPAASFSSTAVSTASLVVNAMPVDAGTSFASAAGSLIVAGGLRLPASSPPPCHEDGLPPSPSVQAEVKASATASKPGAANDAASPAGR